MSAKESGAWLHALPISSLGLRMDDNTVRVAVGLRLGSTLSRPDGCQHYGAEVDHLATHGLSCKNSEGHHYRHGAINDIVHRALTTAQVPSRVGHTVLLEGIGAQGEMLYWGGEGKGLPFAVPLGGGATWEHCFSVGVSGGPADLFKFLILSLFLYPFSCKSLSFCYSPLYFTLLFPPLYCCLVYNNYHCVVRLKYFFPTPSHSLLTFNKLLSLYSV